MLSIYSNLSTLESRQISEFSYLTMLQFLFCLSWCSMYLHCIANALPLIENVISRFLYLYWHVSGTVVIDFAGEVEIDVSEGGRTSTWSCGSNGWTKHWTHWRCKGKTCFLGSGWSGKVTSTLYGLCCHSKPSATMVPPTMVDIWMISS